MVPFGGPDDTGPANNSDIDKVDYTLYNKQHALCVLANVVQEILAPAAMRPLSPSDGAVWLEIRVAFFRRAVTLLG